MLKNIPQELRDIPHWVIGTKSDIKEQNKVPHNPNTGKKASPTDKATWGTYEQACSSRTDAMPHVGFVLSSLDPYTIIDLDDPYDPTKDRTDDEREAMAKLNQQILSVFPSYTEVSQSGTGVHIIIRGSIPKGVNKDTVELYCMQRYMICTGNVMKDLPIIDCQEMLDNLYKEMESKSSSVDLEEVAETEDDADIVAMASGAENGDKFNSLCNGDFAEYPSQSEADLALLSIIAFYTESNEQVRRIFRMSKLGKREKAVKNDTYLNFALGKIRAHALPKVDFTVLKERMLAIMNPTANHEEDETIHADIPEGTYEHLTIPEQALEDDKDAHIFPHGLVGEIADYIYKSAARPVKEIGLMAAIGLMSGITGRQYNISGVGLNHYLILLAKTGSGKEGIASGIDRIHDVVRKSVPMMDQFAGPSAFASGPALVKTMAEKPVFLSILGEFGLTLQQICDPKAMGAHVSLRHALLDLYQKSGWHSILRSSVYSDREKNTADVQAPALSLIGESNPDTFFQGLSEHHISDGLIPRFSIREYKGKRPYLNEGHGFPPSKDLEQKLVDLVTHVLTNQQNDAHTNIRMDATATAMAKRFETETTDIINNSKNDVLSQLWNRAHLKALKMAGLIAVGVNSIQPTVTEKELVWAIAFVKDDIEVLMTRFITGDIGDGESKQEADFIKKVNRYFETKPKAQFKPFHAMHAIPASWFRDNIKQLASFRNDSRGGSKAMQSVIASMLEAGMIQEMAKQDATKHFKTSAKVYVLGDQWQPISK